MTVSETAVVEKKKRERGVTYLLERIPPDLWDGAKKRAFNEGHPLRWVLLRLVELYAKVGLDVLEKDSHSERNTP